MPRPTISLLCTGLLAAIAGATYALRFNPEMDFWKEAAVRKLAWVDEMRSKHGHVIGVVGGSTTTFGIDAQSLEREHNLPVANLGLHAGMGPDVCAGIGFAALQKGDTLIVSIEPSLLCEDESEPTSLGVCMAWALVKPAMVNWRDPLLNWRYLLNPAKLQPGGYHVMTMLGKLALKQPLYRYNIDDARLGGLQVTSEHRPSVLNAADPEATYDMKVSPSGHALLAEIRDQATSRGLRVAYVLPWAYASKDEAGKIRSFNQKLLDEIEVYLPVIRERQLGVWTEPGDFSDSRQHLTEQAARNRSNHLAPLLRQLSLGADRDGN
jgi:hypothetical protein